MKNTTCLQYCINGMSDKLFNFAKTQELLIGYNSYFLFQAGMQLKGMPKHPLSVIEFMGSEDFTALHDELTKTVQDNYPMLMSYLDRKQKRKLEAMFA
jgi:hypothetical protein